MKVSFRKSMLNTMLFSMASLLFSCDQMGIEGSQAGDDPSDDMVAETEQPLVVQPVPNAAFRIRVLSSLMCIDIPQGCDDLSNPETCLGAPLMQVPCNGNLSSSNNTQSFTFTWQGGANYEIKHTRTGRCVIAASSNTQNGGAVALHHCSVPQLPNKQFVVEAPGPNIFAPIRALHSGLCLNIVGGSLVRCAALYQFGSGPSCTGESQQFRLEQLRP